MIGSNFGCVVPLSVRLEEKIQAPQPQTVRCVRYEQKYNLLFMCSSNCCLLPDFVISLISTLNNYISKGSKQECISLKKKSLIEELQKLHLG